MPTIEIDDSQHISRYCKPLCVSASGLPLGCAFYLRSNEEYLSVNWLGYYDESDLHKSLDCVREAFQKKGFSTSKRGRYVILKVSKIKSLLSIFSSEECRVEHLPSENDPSHSGIFGYSESDKTIALRIAELATLADMHPTWISTIL